MLNHLPDFEPSITDLFQWGDKSSKDFRRAISDAYREVVHRSLFEIPSGRPGNQFIEWMTNLLSAFATKSVMEGIAMTAVMLIPSEITRQVQVHRTF